MEWDLCPTCAETVGVLIQTAEVFGPAGAASIVSALCGTCAAAGLAAIAAG